MRIKFRFLFVLILLVLPAGVLAQTPDEVKVKLSLADNKTTYRIGALPQAFASRAFGAVMEQTMDI